MVTPSQSHSPGGRQEACGTLVRGQQGVGLGKSRDSLDAVHILTGLVSLAPPVNSSPPVLTGAHRGGIEM